MDLARGLAAFSVFAGHLRNLFFVDYAGVRHKNLLVRALHLLTGYGHEAVVFFVRSGFMVGTSVIKTVEAGRRPWRSYTVNRFIQMCADLAPAFLAQFVLQCVGLAQSSSRVQLATGAGPPQHTHGHFASTLYALVVALLRIGPLARLFRCRTEGTRQASESALDVTPEAG